MPGPSMEFRIDGTSLEVSMVPGSSILLKSGCIAFMSNRLQTKFLGPVSSQEKGHSDEAKDDDGVEDEVCGDDDAELFISEVSMPSGRGQTRALLTINAPMPGSISRLAVTEDQTWIVRKSAFLAATPGITLQTESIAEDDMEIIHLLRVSCVRRGSVFVHTFGKAKQQDVPYQESALLSAGLFVASQVKRSGDHNLAVQATPSVFTTSSGIAWPMLRIDGPAQVLMQAHNLESFAYDVDALVEAGRAEDDSEDEEEVGSDNDEDEDEGEGEGEDEDDEDEDEDGDEDEDEDEDDDR